MKPLQDKASDIKHEKGSGLLYRMRQNSNDRSVIPIARGAGNSEIL
jgi:hypothetical protein